MRPQELPTQPSMSTTVTDRPAKIKSSPFVMPRKVADVFVVMEGQVSYSILKNNKKVTMSYIKHN